MKVHGYKKEFKYHSQEEIDNWDGNRKVLDLSDEYYYKVINILGCKNEELLTMSIDDFTSEDDEYSFNCIFHKDYLISSEELIDPTESGPIHVGLTRKYTIRIRDKVYNIIYAQDMGYGWYYFTRSFIKDLSKISMIPIKYDFLIPWDLSDLKS